MARDERDGELDAGERHRLAALQQVLGRVRRVLVLTQQVGLPGRHPHVDTGIARDRGDASQVVDVAVGHEHPGRGPAVPGEVVLDQLRRIAGVDDGRLRTALPGHEIAVGLVGAERELDDVEAERPVHAAGPPCFF